MTGTDILFDEELARVLQGATPAQARERLAQALALLCAGEVDFANPDLPPTPLPAAEAWCNVARVSGMLQWGVQEARRLLRA